MFAAPVIVVCLSILGCITSTRSLFENPVDSNVLERLVRRLRKVRRVVCRATSLRGGCSVTRSAYGMTTVRTARGMTAAA